MRAISHISVQSISSYSVLIPHHQGDISSDESLSGQVLQACVGVNENYQKWPGVHWSQESQQWATSSEPNGQRPRQGASTETEQQVR